MNKNWLTLRSEEKAIAPDKKAQLAARQDDFARKVGALRKATGKLETRRLRFLCACTSGAFVAEFERDTPAELFRVARIEKEPAGGQGNASFAAATRPAERVFDFGDFDTSGWHCPGCGNGGDIFVHCHCGNNVCKGRTKYLPGGREMFTCHPGCGSTGELQPYEKIHTEQPRPSTLTRGRPALPGAAARPALPPSDIPRLSGPRR